MSCGCAHGPCARRYNLRRRRQRPDDFAGWLVEQVDGSGRRAPPPQRHDYYLPGCAPGGCTNNASVADPVAAALEDNEYALWLQKLRDNAIVVGPAPLSAVAGTIRGTASGGAESIGSPATTGLTIERR